MTHQEAKRIVAEHLRAEGSTWVAGRANRDHRYGVWIVSYRDPAHPREMLDGGALVVLDDGVVHSLGSTPDALDHLMMDLGISESADAWEREGEGLALLADLDMAEAEGLAAYADEQYRKRQQRDV